MVKTRKNLTGEIFGRLTVLQQAEDYIDSKGIHYAQWLCGCSCSEHNNIIVSQGSLKQGKTISCGCCKKELVSKIGKNNKKYNRYDLSGEYGVGYTSKGEEFWFDLEDYDKIKNYCWHYTNTGYVSTTIYFPNKKEIFLHCLVMDSTKELFVDHINHPDKREQKKDNRKSNLRFVTDSQNQMNKCMQINNTSNYKGINFNKSTQSWIVRISVDGKRIYLGCYNNLNEAVEVRKQAEVKYFKKYRYKCKDIMTEEEFLSKI